MNQVFHLYRNDLRRLLPLLAGWFGLLLIQLGLVFRLPVDVEPRWNTLLDLSEGIPAVEFYLIFLIGVLVLGHPTAGTRPHWLTVPIRPRQLVAAKALWIILLLVLPAALGQVLSLHRLGMALNLSAWALGQSVFHLALLALGAWACAAMVSKLSHFVGGMFCLSIAWFLLQIPIHQLTLDRNLWLGSFGIVELTEVLVTWQVFGICLALILLRTWSRKALPSVVVSLLGLITMVSTAALWTWDGFGVEESNQLEVRFNPHYLGPHDNAMRLRVYGDITIYGRLEVSPLPEDRYVLIARNRGSLDFPDGTRFRSSAAGHSKTRQAAIEAVALGRVVILNHEEERLFWDRLFHIEPAAYERYGKQPGLLRLMTTVESYRFERHLEIPLKKGASGNSLEKFWTLTSVAVKNRKVKVRYLERDFGRSLDPRHPLGRTYLVNRQEGTAVRESEEYSPEESQYWQRAPFTSSPQARFTRKTALFDLPDEIDDPQEWLRHATLVKVESFLDSAAVRDLEIKGFRMADYSAPTLRQRLGKELAPDRHHVGWSFPPISP